MFYIKESEIYLNSKQICKTSVRIGAVEEEVPGMQEVTGSNPCKDGNLQ